MIPSCSDFSLITTSKRHHCHIWLILKSFCSHGSFIQWIILIKWGTKTNWRKNKWSSFFAPNSLFKSHTFKSTKAIDDIWRTVMPVNRIEPLFLEKRTFFNFSWINGHSVVSCLWEISKTLLPLPWAVKFNSQLLVKVRRNQLCLGVNNYCTEESQNTFWSCACARFANLGHWSKSEKRIHFILLIISLKLLDEMIVGDYKQ